MVSQINNTNSMDHNRLPPKRIISDYMFVLFTTLDCIQQESCALIANCDIEMTQLRSFSSIQTAFSRSTVAIEAYEREPEFTVCRQVLHICLFIEMALFSSTDVVTRYARVRLEYKTHSQANKCYFIRNLYLHNVLRCTNAHLIANS